MHLRHARASDLPAITTIYAAAFFDEEFMGALMHPHRQTYPRDYRRYWEEKVREWYWDYSHQLVVAYTFQQTSAGAGEEEVVTGVGDWIRYGKRWERYWGNIITPIFHLNHLTLSYWFPNRAANPAIHNVLPTLSSYTKHLWSGAHDTGWYLNYLAVDPAYQNQGYGRALTTWGIERARLDNIAASVISGSSKERFYQRCGFGARGGRISDGKGNPLEGKIEGGAVIFRDPKVE